MISETIPGTGVFSTFSTIKPNLALIFALSKPVFNCVRSDSAGFAILFGTDELFATAASFTEKNTAVTARANPLTIKPFLNIICFPKYTSINNGRININHINNDLLLLYNTDRFVANEITAVIVLLQQ